MKKIIAAISIPAAAIALLITGIEVEGLSVSKASSVDNIPKVTTANREENQNNTEASQATTEAKEVKKVNLLAVGDNLIHDTLIEAGKKSDASYDYTTFYENVKADISKADIAVINQETILGGPSLGYSGYPTFNSPYEIGDAAKEAGFDIFTCATNHALDKGYAGIEKEEEYFNKHPELMKVGLNTSKEAYNTIKYYESNGIKFAILNYTYGTNGIPLPSGKTWSVNMMDKEKITKDVKEAKANSDIVILFPHWGTEYNTSIDDYQEEYTNLFVNLEVDVVIGTHPHILEPVEWVTSKDGSHKTLVYYSLGNFISHQADSENLIGGMASIDFEKEGDRVTIKNPKLIPVVTHITKASSKYNFTVYKLADYTNALSGKNVKSGMSFKELSKFAKKVIPEEFLSIQ